MALPNRPPRGQGAASSDVQVTASGQVKVDLNGSSRFTPRRSSRAAAQKTQTTSPYFIDTDEHEPSSDDDDDAFSVASADSSLPELRDLTRLAPSARSSLSSTDHSHGNTEGTEYSTPMTSGVNTPSMVMNGKGSSGPSTRAQRQRMFGTKRKRYNPEDDEDDELDTSRDALLARQLHLEEASRRMSLPANASAWNQPTLASKASSSRKSRLGNTVKKSKSVEENTIISKHSDMPISKRLKVELNAGSNIVKFGDEHHDATSISDSLDEDEDEEVLAKPLNSSARMTKYRGKAMQTSVSKGISLRQKSINDRKSKYDVSEISGTDSDSLASLSSGSDIDEFDDLLDMPAVADAAQSPDLLGLAQPNYDLGHRQKRERFRLETHHPELHTMWQDLEDLPRIDQSIMIDQPDNISRELKPFQRAGVAWMQAMEKTSWGGGLLGDEMGMGKTIQAVSLIMSDFPASKPTLVLIPPVALMQWQQEIADYTDGTLTTFVYHGTNAKTKTTSLKDLKKYNVILMSYNSLESMYRKQEKGFQRKAGLHKEKSLIHQIDFHRVILDEAHNIKSRTSGSAKACFALTADHKWCLSGTPLQNRIGELFSLIRFLDIQPFACYFCKQCPCSKMEWQMDHANRCTECQHSGMQHVSVFNQELLNPIQKFGNNGPGKAAFRKLRILTGRFMLRRVKRDHSAAMELPHKEIFVDRHFFGEEENDFAGSIMNNGTRKFETYVAQGVLLNNYANIFGLIMQMRQVADHPDLILKKNNEGGQNLLVCCVCDETAEDAIRSVCRHDFCRECAKHYMKSAESPDCPRCHIGLAIDLEAPTIEQDENQVKKSSIINRIKMEDWVSSTKIEALVQNLYQLRYNKMSTKSIIFSQFTSMLDLIGWRLHRAGITTVALDGSMTPAQRQASINHFMTDSTVECFLVSLKAGGVALNLTEASHVFIVDPWWNPAAEWQSADRCHRIGQARPCSITRLCIEDSVESRMVLLQEKKANMINSTINSDDSAMESLTPEDMQFLFRGN